jgi:hypothetical protein
MPRLAHLACLAGPVSDAALLVAHHHKRGEGEATAAFHHFRHTIDRHQLIGEPVIGVAVIAIAPSAAFSWFTCHMSVL